MADRISAFTIKPRLAELTGTYPPPQAVLEAAAEGRREKAILARLWISEGIPFAFRDCPGLYETCRGSLAKQLQLDAKQISIVGSGRLGYSLAPKRWGTDYQEITSDLDLFAVDEGLFEGLKKDFERWRDDYDHGRVQPKPGKQETTYWPANREETPREMNRGFIGSHRVPNLERYGMFLKMNQALDRLRYNLQEANKGPKPKGLSLRCYKNWCSYENQIVISLDKVTKTQAGQLNCSGTP